MSVIVPNPPSDLPGDIQIWQRAGYNDNHRLIVIRPIAGGGLRFDSSKDPVVRPTVGGYQAAPTAMTVAATITSAALLGKLITGTHAVGATQAYTLPTGAIFDAAVTAAMLTAFAADESVDVTIINLSSAAADTITLTAASGFTIVGDPIIQSAHASSTRSNSGTFRLRKTAADTYVAYRVS